MQLDFIPKYGAMVLPLVKHPFIVGFLVAELPNVEAETCMNSESTQVEVPNLRQSPYSYGNSLGIQPYKEDLVKTCQITLKERSRAIKISQSLAHAYVIDQVSYFTFPFWCSHLVFLPEHCLIILLDSFHFSYFCILANFFNLTCYSFSFPFFLYSC